MEQNETPFSIALKCECLNYEIENSRNHYGRFAVYPFLSGQAITVGTAIRRALLGEIESTYITSAHIIGASHEYSTLTGVRESVHDILLNLKDIVFKSTTKKTQKGIIVFQGPGIITSEDIKLPSSVTIVDKTQYIARLETPTQIEIHLIIQKGRGWHPRKMTALQESTFLVDSVLKPVRNTNYTIHSLGEGQTFHELLIVEIWTNGSLSPQEALYEASQSLTFLFQPFLSLKQGKEQYHLNDISSSQLTPTGTQAYTINQTSIVKESSIDQLHIPIRASNCLKKAKIYTVLQLLNYTQEDLLKIKNLGKRSAEHIFRALQHLGYALPKTR